MFVIASTEGVLAATVGPAAIVAVALITAVTTNRRQREALKHDRDLADLADLRRLLDATATTLSQTGEFLHFLRIRFSEEGMNLKRDHRRGVAAQGKKLKALTDRLRVRLGSDSPAARHCTEASDAVFKLWSATGNLEDAEGVATVDATLLAEEKAFDRAVEAFLNAAVELAGTARM